MPAPVAQRTEQGFPKPLWPEQVGHYVEDRLPSLVDWVYSPDWVTPEQAAFLMGRGYDLATIHELMTIGAFDLLDAADGATLIERASLRKYQEVLLIALSE